MDMAHRVTPGVEIAGYRRDDVEVDPPYLHPDYVATRTRSPKRPLLLLPHTLSEVTGPVYGHDRIGELDHDLTRQHEGEPLGERIILHGRVLDGDGRPVRDTLVEIWQANSAGRYLHAVDRHPAPVDPNFTGAGRCVTDSEGRYRFVTIKPGAYPWPNHPNAWRAQHVHFSVFGPAFATRLVTQMYFPGDPLFFQDPIFHSVRDPKHRDRMMRDPKHRDRMISAFDLDNTVEEWALAYRFDIVLRGREATPMED
jgi:protocatechuate 3,4-dioxygenase, beta subunit